MAAPGERSASSQLLVMRVRAQLCAVPISHVVETCRPLPTEPLSGAPSFVTGLALIRARATPVVDARRLLGHASNDAPARYVTLRLGAEGSRVVALAVDAVVGAREVAKRQLESLPGLLGANQSLLLALGTLDSELLLLIEHTRLLPEAVWVELERERASA